MVTYGFYNSVDHDRTYDATQVSELFDGLIEPGVYNSIGERFKVTAVENSCQVRVGTGRAWFNHTWTKNDAPLILNLPDPPTMADRYRSDAIVIDINADIKVRENKITYVCGEESASEDPPHPTLATGTHTQIPLAFIRRGAKNAQESSIDSSQVNYVVGKEDGPPWVVGVLQTADISVYVQRWEDAWDTWFTGKQTSITADINNFHAVATAATNSVNTDKAAFKAFVTEQVSEFTVWMSDKKDGFDTWFANLQYILDGDVAGHLQNEIEDLQDRVVPIEKGGTGNTHGHIQSGFKSTNYEKGEFATAEGMHTAASGKASHAEGGGYYTYQYMNEHLEFDGDNYVYTGDLYPSKYSINPSPTIEGASQNIYRPTLSTLWTYDITSRLSGCRSLSCAIELIDITDNVILKHDEINLDIRDLSSKIITDYSDGSFSYLVYSTPDHIIPTGSVARNIYDYDAETYTLERNYNNVIWYMDGDTVENSNIIVNGSFLVKAYGRNDSLTNGIQPYIDNFTRVFTDPSTGNIDKERTFGVYYTSSQSYPKYGIDGITQNDSYITTSANNTHTYKLKIYYSYTLLSESSEVDHKIIWVPAGDQLTIDGLPTRAMGDYSHAEGYRSLANGDYSHSEGKETEAIGNASHAEGYETHAIGAHSHVGGTFSKSIGARSFVHGYNVSAYDDDEVAFGYDYNISGSGTDTETKRIRTNIFGLPLGNRLVVQTTQFLPDDSQTINDVVNKNRNGLSVYLKSTTTMNGIKYTTILPNDTFGTFLISLEIIEGDPAYNIGQQDYVLGILKLTPMGVDSSTSNPQCYITTLTGESSLFGSILVIDSVGYMYNNAVYPKVVVSNNLARAVSSSSSNKYIRCNIIRLL